MTNPSPPRFAEALLRLLLPPRADLWFVSQIAGFLHRDTQPWAALLGAATIARTAFDWLVPTVDFQTRSTVSTVLAIGVLSLAGFSAAWRSRSPWIGAFAGVQSAALAAAISVAGTIVILIRFHDPATLAAIRGSGGLPEALTLPVVLIVPGALLGAVGGVVGWVVREFVGPTFSRS
jgi:hypothetical protein